MSDVQSLTRSPHAQPHTMRWRATATASRTLRVLASIGALAVILVTIAARVGHSEGEDPLTRFGVGGSAQDLIDKSAGFRAKFPDSPRRMVHRVEDIKVTTWISMAEAMTFAISSFVVPNDRRSLETSVRDMASEIGGTIESLRTTTFGGHEAVRYVLRTSRGVPMEGLGVQTKGRTYQVQAVGGRAGNPAARRFLASFELIRRSKAPPVDR